jgi:hypothetical protein
MRTSKHDTWQCFEKCVFPHSIMVKLIIAPFLGFGEMNFSHWTFNIGMLHSRSLNNISSVDKTMLPLDKCKMWAYLSSRLHVNWKWHCVFFPLCSFILQRNLYSRYESRIFGTVIIQFHYLRNSFTKCLRNFHRWTSNNSNYTQQPL